MSKSRNPDKTLNPDKPRPDAEKFRPANVTDEGPDKGRPERDMEDLARGSEPETRGRSGPR
jgi:hypothetical protein